jgi:DNA-binding SARP family transcriptional activator
MTGRERSPDGDGRAAEPSVHVRVLGELEVQAEGADSEPVTSARGRSLLAYLVCHPDEWHSRQRLAFTFWPDSTESQARTNLRNVLHVIRRAVAATEPFLEQSAGSLRWRSSPACWTDVAAFTAAVERAETSEPGSDAELAALREASELYRGDLLEDCYDDWVVAERERLRDRSVFVWRRLAEALSGRGAHAEAIAAGREVTRRAPLDEDGYRLRMHFHAAAGDTTGALRVYHECTAILRQELGVEPSPLTRADYERLTRVAEMHPDQSVAAGESPFVGRARELGQLEALWTEAERGRPRLVLLSGEAGIGKTRLAEQVAGWVAHRGATVCSARAYPAEGDLGFGVVATWLRDPEVMAHVRRLTRPMLAELSRVLPELGEPRRVSDSSVDDADRLRLFDACMAALTRAGRPLLLVLDDAQWSDPPSLQFVHFLLRNPARCPLLVLATVRSEEVEHGHPLRSIVASLEIGDKTAQIGLERFDRTHTIALAHSVAGTGLDDSTGDALFADTEGNPLFIVETLRARADAGTGAGARMTPKLRAVIDARLDRLGAEARAVVDVAATVGRSFTPDLLARAGRFEEQVLVRALDELWRRGLIREHGLDGYDFGHPKIRDAAYDTLSPATRRRNHLAIALALIETDPGGTAMSGQIAVNFDRAGELAHAVDWYARAAREALLRSAYSEAVRFLERARELAADLPGGSGQSKELEILAMLSPAIAAADSYASERQDAVLWRATELSTALRVELDPSLLRSHVMRHLCRNEFERAQESAARLAESASRSGDLSLAIESEYLLGISAFWACDLPRARDHFLTVIERFDAVDRVEHAVRFGHDPKIVCTSRLANTLWFLGDRDAAVSTRERAAQLSVDAPHPFSANVAKVFAAVLAVDMGDPDDIRARADELARGGDRAWVFGLNASVFNGYVDVLAGRPVGLRRMRAAIDDLRGAAPAPGAISTLTRVFVGAFELGTDAAGGLDAADRALDLEGTRLWEAELRRLRGVFLARSGASATEVGAELDHAHELAVDRRQASPLQRIAATRAALLETTR